MLFSFMVHAFHPLSYIVATKILQSKVINVSHFVYDYLEMNNSAKVQDAETQRTIERNW